MQILYSRPADIGGRLMSEERARASDGVRRRDRRRRAVRSRRGDPLKQLAAAGERELGVCVVEKGSEVGAHILSGAVFEPRALTS